MVTELNLKYWERVEKDDPLIDKLDYKRGRRKKRDAKAYNRAQKFLYDLNRIQKARAAIARLRTEDSLFWRSVLDRMETSIRNGGVLLYPSHSTLDDIIEGNEYEFNDDWL
jgi:hypothetical protein